MPGEDRKKAARTTIVGGQPPGNERPESISPGSTIPVGIEELLAMAAVDDRFAAELYARPEEAIEASGVRLSLTERKILSAVEEAALRQMVANVGGALPEPDRRAFLGRSAAALLALIGGGAALAACPDKDNAGIRPDKPAPTRQRPDDVPARGETGARPDRPDDPSIRGKGGARPDRPPQPPVQAGATADTPQGMAGLTAQKPDAGAPKPKPKPKPKPRPTRGIRPDRPPRTRGISPDRPRGEVGDPFGSKERERPTTKERVITLGILFDRPDKKRK